MSKSSSGRGPSYPGIGLEEAIEKARIVWQYSKQSPVPTEVVYKYWKYSATSSGARVALAALRKFGLLESAGNIRSGEVRLTDLARKIILDVREQSQERQAAIQEAALKPEIFNVMWQHWGVNTPDDGTMSTYLMLTRGYNESAVGDLIADYKKTMSFARLAESGRLDSKSKDGTPLQPTVGDNVQWTNNGTDMFPTPQPIKSFDATGEYAFFECTQTGIPVEELTIMEAAVTDKVNNSQSRTPPANPFFIPQKTGGQRQVPEGFKDEITELEEGEVSLRMPRKLSAESYLELKQWANYVLKKAARAAGVQDDSE